MRKFSILCLMGVVLLTFTSCILSIFDPKKLVDPTDLKPLVYLPIANDLLQIKDHASNLPLGNAVVLASRVDLKPISYDLANLNFDASLVDSLVLIVKTVNESPMKIRYILSYPGGPTMDSDTLKSATLNSNGDVIEAAKDSLEFYLNKSQIISLGNAPLLSLNISLFQPDKGSVVASVLKNSAISFKIGCRAPVNLINIKL